MEMWKIQEAVDYIEQTQTPRERYGKEKLEQALEMLGNPQKKLKFVHVAGTNGKGSTASMLACILSEAGYRTGLYTSPHLVRYHERMQMDGEPISDEDLIRAAQKVQEVCAKLGNPPIVFEVLTLMALWYFAEKNCEIVVLEVGIGGRLDSTNVIDAPLAAVITQIGLDHTETLGNTIEQIAAEKGGIIKPGCEAVLYPCAPSVAEIVSARCRSCGVTLHPVDMDALSPLGHSLDGQAFNFGDLTDLHLPLLGRMQLYNAATALTVTEVLRRRGWHIDENAVRHGLAQVRWPVRFEVVRQEPLVVMDGGHNPQCMAALVENIADYLSDRPLTVLTGVMGDKDYAHMYTPLLPYTARFITVTPDNPRALPAQELASYLTPLGKPVTACGSVADGAALALESTPPDGAVLCCGSLYLMGEAEAALVP